MAGKTQFFLRPWWALFGLALLLLAAARAHAQPNECQRFCQLLNSGAGGLYPNAGNQESFKCNLGNCKAALCMGARGQTPECTQLCKGLVDMMCSPGDPSDRDRCSVGECMQALGCT
jgi:hypothetical protein